ncbi:MAG: hypothetical protein ACI8VZ_002441, partial [Candidatus Paceibacteria bacterium]
RNHELLTIEQVVEQKTQQGAFLIFYIKKKPWFPMALEYLFSAILIKLQGLCLLQ